MIVAAAFALAGLASWRLHAAISSGGDTNGAVVVAGAPQSLQSSPSADPIPSDAPAMAFSADLPFLEPLAAAADPTVAAVVGKAEIEPADVESNSAEPKIPASELPAPTLGDTYTWHDGDRTLEVRLDPNLTVQSDGDGFVVRGDAIEQRPSKDEPVFWSESGELMALPGGAVLILDPGWDQAAIDAFFKRNGISSSLLTELDFVDNGYFIETEPGFGSLNLANSLASQDGVELSSPNWWIERVLK